MPDFCSRLLRMFSDKEVVEEMERVEERMANGFIRTTAKALPTAFSLAGALIAALALCLTTVAASANAAEGCENEARRVEQGSTFLPDCRAYELVSQPTQPVPASLTYFEGFPPTELTGFEPFGEQPSRLPAVQYGVSIAEDGDAALFSSYQPNSESDAGKSNFSTRGANGWSGESVVPRTSRHGFLCDPSGYVGYSPNMEQVAISVGLGEDLEDSAEDCGHPEPELAPGESQESANLFLRASATHAFQLINVTPPGTKSYDPHLAAISADGSHVVFVSRAQLTSDALNGEVNEEGATEGHCSTSFGNVYEWIEGAVHLVTVMPDGQPVRGTVAGSHISECGMTPMVTTSFTHAVSADGERVVFYAGGSFEAVGINYVRPNGPFVGGSLDLREHPGVQQSRLSGAGECTEPEKACTLQIDAPQGGSGSAGGGQFQWANAATTRVFFTDEEKLTSDSTAQAGKPDLYEYDLEKPTGERLADLTVDQSEAADVLGVSGASQDGSYVYFVARAVLAGSQQNSHGASAVAGEANLYLRHDGATTFIVTLNAEGGDQCDWTAWCLTSRVSQNGLFIAFDSIDSLTGYDSNPVHPNACQHLTGVEGAPCIEAFRYAVEDGVDGALTCVSCNPSGAPPAAEFGWAVIEAPDRESETSHTITLNNALSSLGQVYFETMEKLVAADENGTWDVYEYDGGEGATAQLHLISTGKSPLPSYFDDATPNGSNVFFVTDESLLRADDRADYDLYDARVDGGFAAQSEAIQPPSCEALEACRSPLSESPAELLAGSASLSGGGNLTPPQRPPGGKVEKKAKPPKKLTRKQRLKSELKICRKQYAHKPKRLQSCERRAHRRYGAASRKAGK